jgi:hypothetical protein
MPSRPELLIVAFSRLDADARVLKQIHEFADDYRVTTCGYGPPPPGVADHVQLPDDAVYWRYDKARVAGRQYRAAYWSNPAVAAALRGLEGRHFDVILANDIDTAGLAVRLAPSRGVHLDLHEYAPLQNTELLRFRLFMAPFLSWQLRRFATKATSTSTVCQSIADEYEKTFGLHPLVVTNASPYAQLEPQPVSNPVRIVHAGAALANRKLDILVDAMRGLEGVATLDLYLTKNDEAFLARLTESAAELPNVTVRDAVPYADLLSTLNDYDLGVHLLAPTNFNNRVALPNKFFDYVQARLGLIIGPSPEMARLLNRHELGVVTDDFTPESLRRAVTALTSADVERWKRNAHAAAHALSAESQVAVWRSAVDAIAGRNPVAP